MSDTAGGEDDTVDGIDLREDLTREEAIENAERVIGELETMRAEWRNLTPEERARMPEGLREFYEA